MAKNMALVFLGLSVFGGMVQASPITTPYYSALVQPLYTNKSEMPYANPNAPKGGALLLSDHTSFSNLNSLNGKGISAEGIDYTFDTLLESSLDEGGVMYPLLATKLTYDPQQTNFVEFELNPKAKFHDGSKLSAEDVAYTFNMIRDKGSVGLKMYLEDIDHITVLSPTRVRFDFKTEHNPDLIYTLAMVPIHSAKEWKTRDYSRATLKPALGSGPYIVDEINPGRWIRYKRNKAYWGSQLPVNQGRYNFDTIRVTSYRDDDVSFEAFKSGKYFFTQEKTAKQWATKYDFLANRLNYIKRLEFSHRNPSTLQAIAFNTRNGALQDIAVRQALTYAYDFEWLNKSFFFNLHERLQSAFQNSVLAAVGKPSAEELKILQPLLSQLTPLERDGVLKDWKYPTTNGDGVNRKNLLIARQILLDAGYHYDQKGQLLDKKNQPLQFEFVIFQKSLGRTVLPFIRNAKRLGIDIQLRVVDTPQYVQRRRNFEYDLTTFTLPQTLTPGAEQALFWGSEAADQPGSFNISRISNPVVDDLVKQLITVKTQQQQINVTRSLDRVLRAGYYYIPTYNQRGEWYAYWKMYQHPQRLPYLNIGLTYWWSDAKAAQQTTEFLGQRTRSNGD